MVQALQSGAAAAAAAGAPAHIRLGCALSLERYLLDQGKWDEAHGCGWRLVLGQA